MQAHDVNFCNVGEWKKKVEVAMARVRSLKCHVSELRAYCEALRELRSEERDAFVCEDCSKLINESEEVTIKDSFGNVRGRYHRECFKAIWRAQNWIF